MKYFLISFFFHFFYSSVILSNDIYETNFHKIEITNENISIAKVREINKIKIISIENIFDKVLTKSEKNKLNKLDNLGQSLEYLIKNIIIENEFISKNIYKADIKINYDKDEIINLFRSKKIADGPGQLQVHGHQPRHRDHGGLRLGVPARGVGSSCFGNISPRLRNRDHPSSASLGGIRLTRTPLALRSASR